MNNVGIPRRLFFIFSFMALLMPLALIALILMTIPVLWYIAPRTEFHFVLSGLVSMYSVCLIGVIFIGNYPSTPMEISKWRAGTERIRLLSDRILR